MKRRSVFLIYLIITNVDEIEGFVPCLYTSLDAAMEGFKNGDPYTGRKFWDYNLARNVDPWWTENRHFIFCLLGSEHYYLKYAIFEATGEWIDLHNRFLEDEERRKKKYEEEQKMMVEWAKEYKRPENYDELCIEEKAIVFHKELFAKDILFFHNGGKVRFPKSHEFPISDYEKAFGPGSAIAKKWEKIEREEDAYFAERERLAKERKKKKKMEKLKKAKSKKK